MVPTRSPSAPGSPGGHRARRRAADAAAKLGVRPLTLDVTDDDSVAAAAALVEREQRHLDVLVNNAAVRPALKPVA
ncbi:SDR family oxidoreductase [Amycolatopsis sp. NPDC051061]|uniref:SDR family oxidoreductase n=1 Tax=Amycolatopsis sp. NPDC051061 TaxID=3155042 RepID=UPI00342EAD43